MPLILEGIATTENEDGSVNISPMGPIVDGSMSRLLLRPFQTSTTYHNLKRTRRGVFHVTDDVEMIARCAVSKLSPSPALTRHDSTGAWILADACRWYAFEVVDLDDTRERTSIECRVVDCGRLRDFFGFNRARHAVLEAAILASRVALLPPEQIEAELERLVIPVEKTAGEQETAAFAFLCDYIASELSRREPTQAS